MVSSSGCQVWWSKVSYLSHPIPPHSDFFPGLTLAATLDGKRVDALYSDSLFNEAAAGPGVHAFDVLQRIIDDASFGRGINPDTFLQDTISTHGVALGKLAAEWLGASPDIDVKIGEVLWTCSLLYAVNGTSKASADTAIYADFFLYVDTLRRDRC